MARAQDGDRDAYRALLEDITPYLRALATRCFRDTGDIEDAVQDVLLTVHAVRHAYDPGRPFGPWLVAIANRRIIDRLRRQTRARFREIELTAEHETFSAHPANLQSNLGETTADEAVLHAAIEHLPPDQRQAIRLLKLKEMSLNEAAQASGKSVVRPQGGDPPRHQIPAEIIATAERHAVTKTPDLIDALVECATPVRRLRPPLVRAGLWLAFAGLILALLAIGHGVRARPRGAPAAARLRREHRRRARHRNPRGGGGVHGQPSRPLARVAAAAGAGAGRVGRHHRLWLPDRLGQHRARRRSHGRDAAMFRDPACSPACRWRSRSR